MDHQAKLALWQPPVQEIVPVSAKTAVVIAPLAKQLSKRDQLQIVAGFSAGSYEMVINFVWAKTMSALKKELGTLGGQFLGEMLGRPDMTDDDDVVDAITEREALRLAEELGVVSSTEAMRLRQTQERVAHFARLDSSEIESDDVEMEEAEAITALKACVKNVLGKPKIEVATKFAEFRSALEDKALSADDEQIAMLLSSPYFFRKLTVNVLLSVSKTAIGAKLENALANLNTILPQLWSSLRDTEKWQVGHAYVEVYASGKSSATKGIKEALLKVRGFDFVPENLRSDTFAKAAEAVIRAHEGMNNFYSEEAPIKTLARLGSSIPTPAFPICASAVLAVKLGNRYGTSFYAGPTAAQMIDAFTVDRWQYYLNHCLPSDLRILDKLSEPKPTTAWIELAKKYNFADLSVKNKGVSVLIVASAAGDAKKTDAAAKRLRDEYYGKQK